MNTSEREEALFQELWAQETGYATFITVVDGGPMETQDAGIEIVKLDQTHVAFRVSTHAQDGEWDIGGLLDALKEADDLLERLTEES